MIDSSHHEYEHRKMINFPKVQRKDTSGERNLLTQDVFKQIVQQYIDSVYTAAFWLVGEPTVSQAVTCEVFSKIYRFGSNLKSEAEIPYWIYSFLINICKSNERKNPHMSIPKTKTMPKQLIFKWRKNPRWIRVFFKEFFQFSLNQRVVFFLKEIQELSFPEISNLLGRDLEELQVDLLDVQKKIMRALSGETFEPV